MMSQIPDEDPNFGGVETPPEPGAGTPGKPTYGGVPTSQAKVPVPPFPKPSIGRIVHYVIPEGVLPAIITKVHSDICVNLQVFIDGQFDAGMGTSFVSSAVLGDHWAWPPRI